MNKIILTYEEGRKILSDCSYNQPDYDRYEVYAKKFTDYLEVYLNVHFIPRPKDIN